MLKGLSRQPVQGSPLAKTGTVSATKSIRGFKLINVDRMGGIRKKSPFGSHYPYCFSQVFKIK